MCISHPLRRVHRCVGGEQLYIYIYWFLYMYTYTFKIKYSNTYIYEYIYIYIYIYMCVCMCIYIYIYIYVCVYMYLYLHMHTDMCIYLYIYILSKIFTVDMVVLSASSWQTSPLFVAVRSLDSWLRPGRPVGSPRWFDVSFHVSWMGTNSIGGFTDFTGDF